MLPLQRRCYWLLSGDDGTVLVHYLASKKIGRAHTAPDVHSEAIDQQIWDTAREGLTSEGLDPHLHTSKDQLGYHSQLQDTCMNFGQVGRSETMQNVRSTSMHIHVRVVHAISKTQPVAAQHSTTAQRQSGCCKL